MIAGILNVLLVYVTFFQPLICSAQLYKEKNPDPRQIANITLALILGWLISFADALLVSPFFVTRNLYLLARIALCLYFSNPTLLGALRTYERFLAPLFDTYAPCVDKLVTQHVDTMAKSGVKNYAIEMGIPLFRGVIRVCRIACQLLGVMTASAIPRIPLQRRESGQHQDNIAKQNTILSRTTRL